MVKYIMMDSTCPMYKTDCPAVCNMTDEICDDCPVRDDVTEYMDLIIHVRMITVKTLDEFTTE